MNSYMRENKNINYSLVIAERASKKNGAIVSERTEIINFSNLNAAEREFNFITETVEFAHKNAKRAQENEFDNCEILDRYFEITLIVEDRTTFDNIEIKRYEFVGICRNLHE